MTDIVLGIRLTADGKGLVGEVKLSREELEKLRKTTQEAGRDTKAGAEANRGYAQSLQNVARFAGLSAAAITAMAIGAVKRSVDEAARAEQAHLKLEAVLRATGHAAGFAKPQLDQMAESLKRATGIDDDQIRNSMAVMLTFKQVQGDTFRQAMTMAVDLSKLLGQDLQGSVLMLGKALEDPENGLLALRRAGVSFTDQQKDSIKSMVEFGEQSRALTTILEIMRSQGIDKIAESMNTGYVGSMNQASLAYQDLLKAIGNTSLVRAPTLAFFDALAGRLNAIADTLNRGNLIDALTRLNPLTAPLFGALPVPAEAARPGWRPIRAATETPESQGWRELMKKQQEEIDKVLDKAWNERNEREKRLIEENARGWVAHADAILAESERELDAEKNLRDEYWAREERLRQEDIKGWVAHADAVFAEAEEMYGDLARIAETANEKTRRAAQQLGFTFASSFENAIVQGERLRDVLQGLAEDVLRIFVRTTVTEPLAGMLASAFAGAFTGGGTLQGRSTSTLTAQHGLDFTVGGSGGTDSQFLPILATPGERVTVTPPGHGGPGNVINFNIDARNADREGLMRLEQAIRSLNASLEPRAVAAVFDAQMRGARA